MTNTSSTRPALAALSLAMLLSSLGASIANVALPTLAAGFHATFAQVQWIVLAYLLSTTVSLVGVGRLGDLTGRTRLLVRGIVLFTVASIACAIAPGMGMLIAARVAQGLGGAAMLALTTALAAELVPGGRTGRAMGLLGTMSAVGTAIGPTLGGLLIAASGWRAIFLVTAALGAVAAMMTHRFLPLDGRIAHGGEVAGTAPVRQPALAASLAMAAIVSTVMMATLVVGPFHLSRALGLDAARVGLVMTAGPLVAALTAVPAGRLGDRFGAARITLVGLLVLTAGAVMLAAVPASGVVAYLVPLVVMTAGYGLFQTANNTVVMTGVVPAHRGLVAGMLTLSRNVGLIAGASVMGAVFAFAVGASDMATARPDAVAAGTRTTFSVASMLLGGAVVIGWALRERRAPGYLKMSEKASWSKRSSGLTS